VLPVGLGVLLLLQLFQDELRPAARNRIRLVTLVAMLASSAYHALLDQRYPVTFNLVLLLLCLVCMAAGSLLRIRLYVGLGFAALLLDLASLTLKALGRMDSNARMTWVGVLVFLLGAGIVLLGVHHKAPRVTVALITFVAEHGSVFTRDELATPVQVRCEDGAGAVVAITAPHPHATWAWGDSADAAALAAVKSQSRRGRRRSAPRD
jgi:hypothetical protein